MSPRLIVCADGTWNTPDQRSITNVERIRRAIRQPAAQDGTPQLVHYQRGVGTDPGIKHILGGAFGRGIDENIIECYRFLVEKYTAGAEIFLFGFSRGAYTVRSLAGLIRNCGLLKREHANRIGEAYKLYRDRGDDTSPSSAEAKAFRQAFGREVRIKCVGVWDTVGALGIPVGLFKRLLLRDCQFHDVTLSSWIDNAFHALAIDERRKAYAPSIWEPQDDPTQRVEQVWFAGAHSNCGGGYESRGLSDKTLSWMIQRAKGCGLEFDEQYVARNVAPEQEDGILHDEMRRPWWRVLGVFEREIGAPRKDKAGRPTATRESIDPSAVRRVGQVLPLSNQPYQPKNLDTFLKRGEASPTPADNTRTTPPLIKR
jgi:uncharacterized protein (DUF2235 family)